MIIVNTRIKI